MWQFLSRKKLNLNKEFFGLGQQKHVRMEEENVSGEIKKKNFSGGERAGNNRKAEN